MVREINGACIGGQVARRYGNKQQNNNNNDTLETMYTDVWGCEDKWISVATSNLICLGGRKYGNTWRSC